MTDLRKIYTSSKTDAELLVFVDTGNMIVNEQFLSCPITDARKNKIATYLAAYYADVSDSSSAGEPGPVKRSKLGDADDSYAVPNQMQAGYESSRWGQLAIALDTCNILLSSPKLKASIEVVGDNHIGTVA